MWSRATWTEKGNELEGVVPAKWVENDQLAWPPGTDATKFLDNQVTPLRTWRRFTIIKIKHSSGKKSIIIAILPFKSLFCLIRQPSGLWAVLSNIRIRTRNVEICPKSTSIFYFFYYSFSFSFLFIKFYKIIYLLRYVCILLLLFASMKSIALYNFLRYAYK